MVRVWMRIFRGQRGQALVETAIAVPLLLIIVLGMIDLGRAYNYKNDLTHLANEAVRYATVNYCVPAAGGTCVPIEDAVKNDAETSYLRTNMTVTVCIDDPSYVDGQTYPQAGQPNGHLTAKVTVPYHFLPTILGYAGLNKTLVATATMYQEATYPGALTGGHYAARAQSQC